MSNQLGNVLAVITDSHNWEETTSGAFSDKYLPDVIAYQDYDPYGMMLVDRNYSITTENYRFGFNGYENTDEFLGDNIAIDFGARVCDSRVARFFSIDPRSAEYPWQSVYVYYSNCPILIIDIDGMGGPGDGEGKVPATTPNPLEPGMTSSDNGNIVFNTIIEFNGKNWDYAIKISDVDGGYTFHSFDMNTYVRSNPTYQKGELWKTDTGQEGIWPIGSNPGRPGMSYMDTGYYATSGRTNMVDVIENNPGWVAFSMPKTQQMMNIDKAFQDGGKDAVFLLAIGLAAPFAIELESAYLIFLKGGIDFTVQMAINGWDLNKVDYVDVVLSGFTTPTFTALGGGAIDYKSSEFLIVGYNKQFETAILDAGFKYAFGRNWMGGFVNQQTVGKIPSGFAQDLYRPLVGIPVNWGGKGLRQEVKDGKGF